MHTLHSVMFALAAASFAIAYLTQSLACPKFCQELFIGCDFSSVRPRLLP
jgi:hypothetical protein